MAKQLKRIFTPSVDQVDQTYTINAWHVSQSVDALTGIDDYDITISGSLTITGSIFHAEIQDASGAVSSVLVRDNSTGEYYYTGSYSTGGGGSTDTGSLLLTASVSNNTITFTKGDGTTFNVTVNTGSDTNIANTNLTLDSNRTLDFGGNNLTFNAYQSEVFKISSSNTSEVLISGLPNTSREYVIAYNTTDGALSYISTSSFGGSTDTGSLLTTASVSNNDITFTKGDGSTFNITVDTGSGGGGSTDYVSDVTYETGSIDFSGVGNAFTGSINISDLTGSLVTTSSFNTATGSFMTTGSVSNNTITLTKGDGSTFDLTVDTGSGGGGSTDTGSLLTTASISDATITFTKGDASTFDIEVNNVTSSISSSYGPNIYNTNGILTGNRSLDLNNNNLTFDVVQGETFQTVLDNAATHSIKVDEGMIQILPGTGFAEVSSSYLLTYDSSSGRVQYMSTASFGGGGSTDTGSLLTTASVSNNDITFTKGDGSTFNITVDTGSGGGGSTNTFATMSVGGQNIIADSSTDTLTIANGTLISASANTSTDTYTLNVLPQPQFLTKKETESGRGAVQTVSQSQEITLNWTDQGPDYSDNSNHYWTLNNPTDQVFEYDSSNYQYILVKEPGMYEIEYQLYTQGTVVSGSFGVVSIIRGNSTFSSTSTVQSQTILGGFQGAYNEESTYRKVYYYLSQTNIENGLNYFAMKLTGGATMTGQLSVGGPSSPNTNMTFWSFKKIEDAGKFPSP